MTTRNGHASDTENTLGSSIRQIKGLDRSECLDRWREVFGHPPPKYVSIGFIKRVLIWNLQSNVLGGVSRSTVRALRRIAAGDGAPIAAGPGTRLVREWNGRTYQVEVTSNGYLMDGKTYRSLSSVARQITGARWSGPRFFGIS